MELDFILELEHDIMAVEVKFGRDRRVPSFGKVRSVFEEVNRRVVLARCNIYTDKDEIEHYSLFTTCFADELTTDWDSPEFVTFNE